MGAKVQGCEGWLGEGRGHTVEMHLFLLCGLTRRAAGEGETESETETETDRQREGARQTDKEAETETETERWHIHSCMSNHLHSHRRHQRFKPRDSADEEWWECLSR